MALPVVIYRGLHNTVVLMLAFFHCLSCVKVQTVGGSLILELHLSVQLPPLRAL